MGVNDNCVDLVDINIGWMKLANFTGSECTR